MRKHLHYIHFPRLLYRLAYDYYINRETAYLLLFISVPKVDIDADWTQGQLLQRCSLYHPMS